MCVSARLKWSESHVSRFLETKLKFKTVSKCRCKGEGLKRYMKGVVGPFALRQGQGLDTKPSLRGDGKASLGIRGEEVEFVDLGGKMGPFSLERKAIEKNTYMQRTVSKFLSNLFI